MKKVLIITLTVLMLLSLTVISGYAAGKKLTFLFVPGVDDPFYRVMEKGVVAQGKKLGVNIIVAEYPKSWGPEAQVPIMESAAARGGIDLIITAPTAVDALIAPLKKFYDQGIEIITVDTFLGDGDYSKSSDFSFPLSYMGSENEQGGEKIADNLAMLVGKKGKVYCVSTNPDVSSVMGRVSGFKKGIAKYPNMSVVGVDYCMDSQQKAQEQTTAALQKDPDIVGIFGVNVYSAQGANQAVVNSGMAGAVKIASWDATLTNIEALKKGVVDLVLAQKPGEMGSLAVDWGYKYITSGKKTKVPRHIATGFEFFTRKNVDDPKMQQFIYK